MLHDLARGMDGRRLRPRKPVERLRAEAELEPPVDNVEPLRFVLRNLCGALCEQLTARGAGATRALLVLDMESGQPLQLDQVLPEPAAAPELLERLLVARLTASPPTSGVTRLALELRGEQSVSGQQLGLFAPQLARAARLDWQLTGLALRFGADRLLRARIIDPEATVPEQRIGWSPATAEPMSSPSASDASARPPSADQRRAGRDRPAVRAALGWRRRSGRGLHGRQRVRGEFGKQHLRDPDVNAAEVIGNGCRCSPLFVRTSKHKRRTCGSRRARRSKVE